MRITSLELLHVRPRWLFLIVHTDEGIDGYGEPIVEGRARTLAEAVRELEPLLIGEDPTRIEHLWQKMYRGAFYRGGPVLCSAISGVDTALWDITGKALGVPVHRLLGGPVRDRVRMYPHVGGSSPAEIAEAAKKRVSDGFTCMKMSVTPPLRHVEPPEVVEREVERFAAVRAAVGNGIDIAIDFHGRVSYPLALRLTRALEPYNPMFIEEPVLPDDPESMALIARSTVTPIATGERLFTRWGFSPIFEKRAASIVQPDLAHCGGISEGRRIAAAAETVSAGIAPHNPLGPINLAASLQLALATPNFIIQEFSGSAERRELGVGLITEPFEVKAGYIERREAPGLGIELEYDSIVADEFDGTWTTPTLTHTDDGSVAEW